jgi:hypothetical protein
MYKLKSATKTTTEKLDFRFSPSGYVTMFLDDETGMVSMQTDWDDFSYRWGAIGDRTLKQFLAGCDNGYLMDKFCRRDYFDLDVTKKKMLAHLKDVQWELSKEQIKECEHQIKELSPNNQDELYHIIDISAPAVYELVYDDDLYGVPAHMDYKPRHICFFEDVWPMVREKLKEGL